eukprot:1060766-Rhodomonas_salina.1
MHRGSVRHAGYPGTTSSSTTTTRVNRTIVSILSAAKNRVGARIEPKMPVRSTPVPLQGSRAGKDGVDLGPQGMPTFVPGYLRRRTRVPRVPFNAQQVTVTLVAPG